MALRKFGIHKFTPRFLGTEGGGGGADRLVVDLRSTIPGWLTLTRNHASWYRQADDVNGERWASVLAHAPRFDHLLGDAVVGFMIEPARTNLLLRSGALNHVTWQLIQTPNASAVTGIDGTTTYAYSLTDNDGALYEAIYQTVSGIANGTKVCLSAFAKCVTAARAELASHDGTNWPTDDATAQVPVTSTTWKRYSVVRTDAGGADIYILMTGSTLVGFFYDAGGGGASQGRTDWSLPQMESGALWPSSPIITAAGTVARPADVVTAALAKLGGRITAAKGGTEIEFHTKFAHDEEAADVWYRALTATCALRYQGSDDKFEILSGGARVASVGATFARGDKLKLRWTWADSTTALDVYKNSVLLGSSSGAWTEPTLGASMYWSDAAGAKQAGAVYLQEVLG